MTVTTATSHPSGTSRGPDEDGAYRRLCVAVIAGGVATFASLYSTQAILPSLGEAFRVDAGAAAWSVSAATSGMAAGLLVSGPLSDRFGRRPLMRWSLVATALFDLLAVFATDWAVLIGLRGAQGLALSFYPAAAAAYLREEIPADRHARVSGLYIGGTAIGGMLGRIVAALGAGYGGWRAGLAALAVLVAGCAVCCWTLLPPSGGFRTEPARRSSLRTAGLLVRDPVLLALWALGGLAMGTFAAVFTTIGFRLESVPYSLDVTVVGAVFGVYAFGSVASGQAGKLAGRWGCPVVVRAGTVVLLAGLGVLSCRPLIWVVIGLIVFTCGFFTVHGVLSGWVAARAEAHRATGQASAIYLFVYYLGSSVAGSEAGRVWTGGGWTAVGLLAGVLGLLAVVLSSLLVAGTGLSGRCRYRCR